MVRWGFEEGAWERSLRSSFSWEAQNLDAAKAPAKAPQRQREAACADAETDHADRAGRRARRDAEDKGFGRRVAEKRLEDRPAHRQARSCKCGHQRPAEPQV